MRQQAITWANGDSDLCCHMMSRGHNELTHCGITLVQVMASFLTPPSHWPQQYPFIKNTVPTCIFCAVPLQWHHNGRGGISNHQPHDCLFNFFFGRESKKTSKLCVTGLCVGNSPLTVEFPAQMASYAENVSIWWCHHALDTQSLYLLSGETSYHKIG